MNWNKLPAFIDDALITLTSIWSSQKVSDEINKVQSNVDGHAGRTDNPHSVTAIQVGAETPSGAQAKANVVQSSINAHTARIDNPHSVTAAQVGAETPAGAQAKANVVQTNLATHIASGTHSFVTGVTDKPSTIGGYGITNAYTKTEVTSLLAAKANLAATLAGYGITDAYTKPQVDANIATAVAALVNSAPTTLDTINELAEALGDDPNFSTTVFNLIGTKLGSDEVVTAATANKVLRLDANGKFPWAVLANVPSSFTPAAHNQAWSTITGTPTTLAGYGITDAYTKAAADVITNNHLNSTAAHTAMNITNAPGSIVKSVNVQNALDELANYNGFASTQIGAEQGELGVEIKGRTLVNLFGSGNYEDMLLWAGYHATLALDQTNVRYGSSRVKVTISTGYTSGYLFKAMTVYVGKYYICLADVINGNATNVGVAPNTFGAGNLNTSTTAYMTSYKKFTPSTEITTGIQVAVNGSEGQYAYVDGFRFYEITQAEYNAIDSMTEAQVAAKYPYVDSVQFKKDVLVTQIGKNLFDPTNVIQGYYLTTGNVVSVDATNWYSPSYIAVKPSTSYSQTAVGHSVRFYDNNYNFISALQGVSTFTTPANCTYVRVTGPVTSLATYQLELGAVATNFEPQVKSYAHTPMQIAEGESVWLTPTTSVYKEVWKKNIVLDGSRPYIFGSTYTGFKRITYRLEYVEKFPHSVTTEFPFCTKYDSSVLGRNFSSWSSGDLCILDNSDTYSTSRVHISISNTDTGWADDMSPTVDDIKAYFYGWKMCASNGSTYVSGTKYWKKITDGTGITSTVPTASYAGYTPYVLHYKLATPVYHINYYNNDSTKPIMSAGSVVNILQGVTQVEQKSGVVWRSTEAILLSSSLYYFNGGSAYALKYREKSLVDIYKNGASDRKNWSSGDISLTNNTRGLHFYNIPQANYDTTASYTISYEQLDKYLYTVDAFAIDNPIPTRQRNFSLDSTEQKIAYFKINNVDLVGAMGVRNPSTLADYGILDAYTKDGVDATVNIISTSINTKLSTANSIGGVIYNYRDVASFSSAAATTTGILKIMLPVGWINSLMTIDIKGFNYVTASTNWHATLAGQNANTTSTWIATSATLSPNCPVTSVRFGYDTVAGKACILLGTASSVWQYPKILISAMVGHNSPSVYSSGWGVGIITDETGITVSSTPTIKTLAYVESGALTVNNASTGNTRSGYFNNTDYAAGNRNYIQVRQQVASGSSYSAMLGVDKDTGNVWLSNDAITTQHLAISPAGNVGIGKTPTVALDVSGVINSDALISVIRTASNNSAIVKVQNDSSKALSLISLGSTYASPYHSLKPNTTSLYTNAELGIEVDANAPITFWTNAAERMRINASGNVGIGVTDPKATLHSTGSTILGCAPGPVWADIGTSQLAMYAQDGSMFLSWKDAGGLQRTVGLTCPSGVISTVSGTNLWLSSEYTPVLNTPTTVTHGLTLDPVKCKCDVLLKCAVAQGGYSVGDYAIGAINSTGNAEYSFTPALNTTTIQVNTSAGIYAMTKTNGTPFQCTPANWRYIFRIWY
ncbi:MAG: hypothetical protein K0Q77_13 [Anaerosporomusa subterranea]|jgi:hypothetical protein|nr:hypothetical protein [Anaerosporomusa subterranea]